MKLDMSISDADLNQFPSSLLDLSTDALRTATGSASTAELVVRSPFGSSTTHSRSRMEDVGLCSVFGWSHLLVPLASRSC